MFKIDEGLKLLIQRYRESIKNTISVQLGRIGSDLSAHTEAYTTETDFGSRSWVVGSNFGNMVTDAFVRYVSKSFISWIQKYIFKLLYHHFMYLKNNVRILKNQTKKFWENKVFCSQIR